MNAREIWMAGLRAVDGYHATKRALRDQTHAPDQIIAIGKAAGSMASAALDHFGPCPALVVTKDGHGTDLPAPARLLETAHPVPDQRSLAAGRALRDVVTGMAQGTRLLVLVSGGASALAEDLVDGYTLDDLSRLNRALLSEGLDITAMNRERRKISRIKGGGLLYAFTGAAVEVLAISDVPGDDLAVIGSGLGAAPASHDFTFAARIIASNTVARAAAETAARRAGLTIIANEDTLHDRLEHLAQKIGARLRNMSSGVLILGGEPTVTLPANPGEGGRNQALALSLAREIAGLDGFDVIVGGTDGSDGPTLAAGGIIDGSTWAPGGEEALARADSGPFLRARGALLETGATGTNVMDLLVAIRA